MYEFFLCGTSFGRASLQECIDYSDYLANNPERREDPDNICIINAMTGEVIEP